MTEWRSTGRWQRPVAAALIAAALAPVGSSRPTLVEAHAAQGRDTGATRLEQAAATAVAVARPVDELLAAKLTAFVAALEPEARAAGVPAPTFKAALGGIAPDGSILLLLASQPEHVLAPWDYLARLVSDKRIAAGRQKMAQYAATFERVARELGVDGHVVAAIWGVESSYGTRLGERNVVRSLATLAVTDARRSAFWRRELIAALKILDRGDVTATAMVGSWAGAMGHTQVMPTSYLASGIDFDGDGRRDIWGSVPDALGTTARYLSRAGWKSGLGWGVEVVLPAEFDFGLAAPGKTHEAEQWRAAGVSLPFGREWPALLGKAALLLPAGRHGPAFLVTDNFNVILRYNNSVSYALAVGHLADRLAGGGPLAAPWPTDDPPLAAAERRELQTRLATLGHHAGPIDGVIGESTREALRAWQRQSGLPEDGWAGVRLLSRLREQAGSGE